MGDIAHFSGSQKLRQHTPSSQETPSRPWLERLQGFSELHVEMDEADGILWQRMAPVTRPSLTFGLLRELRETGIAVREGYAQDVAAGLKPVRYMVLSSELPNIFLMGGDLPMFVERIGLGDEATLRLYAHFCIDVVHGLVSGFDLPIHTIGLVQGDALGGGFEGALANDVVIAERSAKFGLPEILFNLFPGMGAYTLLSRKLDVVRAERMILGGKIYSAEELFEMGLVDVLAEDGQGEAALYEYVERHERTYTARQSIMQARRISKPVSREELISIVDLWVDAAMSLAPADRRKMSILAKAQDRRMGVEASRSEEGLSIEALEARPVRLGKPLEMMDPLRRRSCLGWRSACVPSAGTVRTRARAVHDSRRRWCGS